MRRQEQHVLLAVLIGVMVLVYARALHRSQPVASLTQPHETQQASGPHAATHESIPIRSRPEPVRQREAQQEHSAHLAWGRDPFTRGAVAGAASGLTLSGILWDAQAPVAIINGQMVHAGEELEGYRVVEITQERVSMTDGTQTFQLNLTP